MRCRFLTILLALTLLGLSGRGFAAATEVTIDTESLTSKTVLNSYIWGPGWDKYTKNGGSFEAFATIVENALNTETHSAYKCYDVSFEVNLTGCNSSGKPVEGMADCPKLEANYDKADPAKGIAGMMELSGDRHAIYVLDASANKEAYDAYGLNVCVVSNPYGKSYDPVKAQQCNAKTKETVVGVTTPSSPVQEDGTGGPGAISIAYTDNAQFAAAYEGSVVAHEFLHAMGHLDHVNSMLQALMNAAVNPNNYVSVSSWHTIFEPMKKGCIWHAQMPWQTPGNSSAQDNAPGPIKPAEICLKVKSKGLSLEGNGCLSYVDDMGNGGVFTVPLSEPGCSIEGHGQAAWTKVGPYPKTTGIKNYSKDKSKITLNFQVSVDGEGPTEIYDKKKCNGEERRMNPIVETHFYDAVTQKFLDKLITFNNPEEEGAAVTKDNLFDVSDLPGDSLIGGGEAGTYSFIGDSFFMKNKDGKAIEGYDEE